MIEIDMNSWDRREHFHFFRQMDYPLYNICYNMDITGLKEYAKAHELSLNHCLLYLATATASSIDNFCYRVHGDKVVRYKQLHPSFAAPSDKEGLFKYVTLDFDKDLKRFHATAREKVQNQKEFFPELSAMRRDDLIYFSAVPWIEFTALTHTINLNKDDGVPRISWGRFFKQQDKCLLPLNMQVNHIFVDGYHLGLFKEGMETALRQLVQ